MQANIDDAVSYKTETYLTRAIERRLGPVEHLYYMVVCNRGGRFVALFPVSWNPKTPIGAIAHAGFMVVG